LQEVPPISKPRAGRVRGRRRRRERRRRRREVEEERKRRDRRMERWEVGR
jgi:hypothetical protein